MVPPDQLHPIWPTKFQARQKRYCLHAEEAAVDVVPGEDDLVVLLEGMFICITILGCALPLACVVWST